ncbi:uncharacterized protein LOC117316362 [Pecten maximus]|uniref:uncharacterized protein LOC117316362 n=1 Tax=Pecten maximus TaxID=6579 RepID=UPI001458CF3B|nr:uncharacterized protein LOC117316362 [Pecten maximus]
MAEMKELKTELDKLRQEVQRIDSETARADRLEKELLRTKQEFESYTSSPKTVYINKNRKLDKFSGRPVKETDPTAEEWIEDAIHHLKTITGSDAQVEFLYAHLQGQAKDEIRLRSETEKSSATKILEILRTTFQEAETVGQLQQRFYQRNQNKGETLQEYSLVLLKLMDRIVKKDRVIVGDRDLMLKERFTDGVVDIQLRREMRRYMFEHKDVSFTDFRQLVIRWTEDETIPSRHKSVSVSEQEVCVTNDELKAKESSATSAVTAMLQSQQEMLAKQQQQLDALTKLVGGGTSSFVKGTGRGRGRGAIKCYNCGGRGHVSRECPTERKPGQQQKQYGSNGGHQYNRKQETGKRDLNAQNPL